MITKRARHVAKLVWNEAVSPGVEPLDLDADPGLEQRMRRCVARALEDVARHGL